MPDKHADFVRRENIKAFEKRLETETDTDKRALLLRLLASERAELQARSRLRDFPAGGHCATGEDAEGS